MPNEVKYAMQLAREIYSVFTHKLHESAFIWLICNCVMRKSKTKNDVAKDSKQMIKMRFLVMCRCTKTESNLAKKTNARSIEPSYKSNILEMVITINQLIDGQN